MSLWTQITGLLVVKKNNVENAESLVVDVLGPMSTWENWNEDTIIPEGSEGGIKYFISDSIHEDEVNILFNGNLRDFSSEETIQEWISDSLIADKFAKVGLPLVKGVFTYEALSSKYVSKYNANTSSWVHLEEATGSREDKVKQEDTEVHSYQVVGAIQLDNYGFLLGVENRVRELNTLLPKFSDNSLELKAVATGEDSALQNVSILINGNLNVRDKIKPLSELLVEETEKILKQGYSIRTGVISVTDESDLNLTLAICSDEEWEKY